MNNTIIYDGYTWTKNRYGYYVNTSDKKINENLLHRYIWSEKFGKIKDGYVIHHVDFDKNNNNISNLISLERCAHSKLHGAKRKKTKIDKRNRVFEKKYSKTCIICGNNFEAALDKSLYCSLKCKNISQRKNRIKWACDKEKRESRINGLTKREKNKQDMMISVFELQLKHLTQKEIALELNTTQQNISKYINEIRKYHKNK